jgi:hypothetical protein
MTGSLWMMVLFGLIPAVGIPLAVAAFAMIENQREWREKTLVASSPKIGGAKPPTIAALCTGRYAPAPTSRHQSSCTLL